jgi:hypothetical protein
VRPDQQGYVLLCGYSALSNGFGSFRSFGAKVVVTDDRGSTVTVPLFENTKTRYWVAIALIDFTSPDAASIHHSQEALRTGESRPFHECGIFLAVTGETHLRNSDSMIELIDESISSSI